MTQSFVSVFTTAFPTDEVLCFLSYCIMLFFQPLIAGHSFFGTFMVVMLPSYYFCYRRREHHEQVIEMMMKYNQFGHAKTDLPAEPPIEEHPFWEQQQQQQNNDIIVPKHDREFRGLIKERKEWQKSSKDPSFEEIFQEKK